MFSLALLAIALSGSVSAHMQMSQPYPYNSPLNPNCPEADKDYSMTSPLVSDGTYPCKGFIGTDLAAQGERLTWKAGETYEIDFAGSATHGGGSCQFSLSYDNGTNFRVIESYMGGCMTDSKSFEVQIPSSAPAGSDVIFSWSWFNKIGNREMYQNCLSVDIESSSTTPMTGATIYVANADVNSCSTVEGTPVVFPSPGDNAVIYGGEYKGLTIGNGLTSGAGVVGSDCYAPGSDGAGTSSSSSGSSVSSASSAAAVSPSSSSKAAAQVTSSSSSKVVAATAPTSSSSSLAKVASSSSAAKVATSSSVKPAVASSSAAKVATSSSAAKVAASSSAAKVAASSSAAKIASSASSAKTSSGFASSVKSSVAVVATPSSSSSSAAPLATSTINLNHNVITTTSSSPLSSSVALTSTAVSTSAPASTAAAGQPCEGDIWACDGQNLNRCVWSAWVTIADCSTQSGVVCSASTPIGCVWPWQAATAKKRDGSSGNLKGHQSRKRRSSNLHH